LSNHFFFDINIEPHAPSAHQVAEEYLIAYIEATGIADEKATPLFQTLDRRRQLTATRMDPNDAMG
jgi:hypothetical protein